MIFRLATVALNQTALDWPGNEARILAALQNIAESRAKPDLILFPELCISGYGCEDAFHAPHTAARSLRTLRNVAREAKALLPNTALVLGLPLRRNDRVYNCAGVVYGGKLRGIYAKRNLAGDGVHYEPRWFAADRELYARSVATDSRSDAVPFGNLLFELRGVRFALEICEDSWVSERPALAHIRRGLDLTLNPSASHFAFGKYVVRRNIALESSRSLACAFALVNLLGNEAGRMIYDGSAVAAASGELMLEDRGFGFTDFRINSAEFDIERNRALRSRLYSYLQQDARPGAPSFSEGAAGDPDHFNPVVHLDADDPGERGLGFQSPDASAKSPAAPAQNRPDVASQQTQTEADRRAASQPSSIDLSKDEEFLRAEALALFDYCRKSRSRGFALSLSGGADSAACALLVQRMLCLAASELGLPDALRRLGREDLAAAAQEDGSSARELRGGELIDRVTPFVAEILHTLYQATAQSSEVTRKAAARLAGALGARHREINLQELVDGYTNRLAGVIGRELSWDTDDLALQNIQARVRSPMIWQLANVEGMLLLTTSNRSEAAVGYCTMDGDTSGGLAPIAGIDKAFVQNWLRRMQSEGDALCGPVPELDAITAQQPTAELRPLEQNQTDEADLMPYPLLDRIEKLAIRDRKNPVQVYAALRLTTELAPRQLAAAVRRFFELWSRNQWKRERYAPAFHLDDLNVDPRTWYRFPILSGGFREELQQLDAAVDAEP